MNVLVQINSGKESNKTRIKPDNVDDFISEISNLPHLQIEELLRMGPHFGNLEKSMTYFKITKNAFDRLRRANITNVKMRYLSMDMSNSDKIAIEEGANFIRIGTRLFGER